MTNRSTDPAAASLGSNLDVDDAPVATAPSPAPTAPRGRRASAAEGMPARVKIILDENPDIPPTGLFIGHNGTSYVIRPGEEVEVPSHILSILDTAVISVPQTDPQTMQVVAYRDRPKYPYRRV